MEDPEYNLMFECEDKLWWYQALRLKALQAIESSGCLKSKLKVLDVGCGTGGMAHKFFEHYAYLEPDYTAVDISLLALNFFKIKNESSIKSLCCNAAQLPFENESFDLIFIFDVLYHRDVEQQEVIQEIYRCLRPRGYVFLNLPAYQWLSSSHDRKVFGVRRYTKSQVDYLFRKEGFSDARITYWNTLLFPLMIMSRILSKHSDESDVKMPPQIVNKCLLGVTRLEMFINKFIPLTFGGSVFGWIRK